MSYSHPQLAASNMKKEKKEVCEGTQLAARLLIDISASNHVSIDSSASRKAAKKGCGDDSFLLDRLSERKGLRKGGTYRSDGDRCHMLDARL